MPDPEPGEELDPDDWNDNDDDPINPDWDPVTDPPPWVSSMALDFWTHDFVNVLAEFTRLGAGGNNGDIAINFHSLRIRNGAWDEDERDNGDASVAGMWVRASSADRHVQVAPGGFEENDNPTLAGARLLLVPYGPATVAIGNMQTHNWTFSAPELYADGYADNILSGNGPFVGGRNFEGQLNVLSGTVTDGEAQAELTWTFIPEAPGGNDP